ARTPRGSMRRFLLGLADNPLARREWGGVVRQSRDWRLLVGPRGPPGARGWGPPAGPRCCILPLRLAFLRPRVRGWPPPPWGYLPAADMPDVLLMSFGLVGLYLCLIAVALMAPAIAREREKETWEILRATVASPREIVVGLLAGRLGPVLAGYL